MTTFAEWRQLEKDAGAEFMDLSKWVMHQRTVGIQDKDEFWARVERMNASYARCVEAVWNGKIPPDIVKENYLTGY